MGTQDGTPHRRRRSEPARVRELDALLRDVDDLRLSLETDLTLAASAVECGAPELALDILDSQSGALHGFESRALGHLDALAQAPARRLRVPAHAGPILVAAALVGVLAGAVPQALSPSGPSQPSSVAALSRLERIQQLAAAGSTAQVREASAQFHAQLAQVVATAKTDPAGAQAALLLLSYEQNAITSSGDSSALADVLRQSEALSKAIRAALPAAVRTAAPAAPRPPALEPQPEPTASPKASPKPSPAAKPKPSPSAAASPSSSPSSSPDSVIPTPAVP